MRFKTLILMMGWLGLFSMSAQFLCTWFFAYINGGQTIILINDYTEGYIELALFILFIPSMIYTLWVTVKSSIIKSEGVKMGKYARGKIKWY